MPAGRDRKNEKIPNELRNIGDISFVTDSEFKVRELVKTDASYSRERAALYAGSGLLRVAGLSAEAAAVKAEIAAKGSWSGQSTFMGADVLVEIVSLGGKLPGYFCYFKYIQSAAQLQEQDTLPATSTIFRQLPGFYWWGADAQKDQPVNYTPGIGAVTGYSAAEINALPGRYLSLVYFEDIANVVKATNSVSTPSTEGKTEMSYRVISRDGTVRWVKETLVLTKGAAAGEDVYAGFVADVTELKAIEEQNAQSVAQLRENNLAKDRFINILSHDLRAPFTSILGFAEILLNETQLGPRERSEYLTYIYDASQNQLQFINYLLDWSRLKTGSLKIEAQRIRLQAIAYNCVSILTGNAIRKNITINVDIPETVYVQADDRLLTQVVLNLLSNAIKFSFDGGAIEITASSFNETQVEIIVRDHGMGIAPEEQQKIFKIEKMISQEGTRGEKGSGFGLALVKEIVAKHGGEIWFYSEAGGGSEFHFTVPQPTNVIILIAGDEADQSSVIELLREQFPGFTVVAADNGFEGLGFIDQYAPNAVIADHSMPLINGLQLVEAIKHGEAELKIPVVIYGDGIPPEDETQYYRLGVRHILKKPFYTPDFEQALRSVLN